MKALKGLFVYIGIVLGIILALGVLLFAIMYFVPNFRIMNVGVIHASNKIENQEIVLSDYTDFNKIELSVGNKRINANIQAVSSDASKEDKNKIACDLKLNYIGLSFDITEYKVIKNVKVEDSTLKVSLNITEPNGWISYTDSYLNIVIPTNYPYDIITNTDNADINISGGNNLTINSITMHSTTGSLKTSKLGTIEKIDGKNITKLNLNSLNITTKSGDVDFGDVNELTVNSPIKIYSEDGDFTFKKLNASLEVKGKGIKISADEINCGEKGFNFIAENGYFSINKINSLLPGSEVTIIANNADVSIKDIVGKVGIVTTYGSINIFQLSDTAYLKTEHGNINVKKALSDISAVTHYGNITVDSYDKNGTFESVKGNISVNSTSEYIKGVVTKISNRDGEINAITKANKLLLNTTGKSKVKVTFQTIVGGLDTNDTYRHTIKVDAQGSCIVYMPAVTNVAYKFIAVGNITGSIIGLNGANGIDKVVSNDNYQYYPDDSYASDAENSVYFYFAGNIHFEGYQVA